MISNAILRAYDIRGIVGETINANIAYNIGCAFGSELIEQQGGNDIIVGRDGRLSSPELTLALISGLKTTGINIIDIGMVATPMGYFATHIAIKLNNKITCNVDSCIIVTGSHNPPNYNGFKMIFRGQTMYGEKIHALCQRINNNYFIKSKVFGKVYYYDISDQYINCIINTIKLKRNIKIVLDAGNGVAGAFAPRLFRALGCDVIELHCNVDGRFPNHHPDPTRSENLQDVIHMLFKTNAEIGFAFDGDGDRLGVVTKDGQIIFADRQLMLFSEEILKRNPYQKIIFDVKCTRNLSKWILQKGGEPIMWKTGHSLIKAKLQETGAPLAGEMSGHIFFKDRWYGFDDGMYTAARMLEILSVFDKPSNILNALPNSFCTPELQIYYPENKKNKLIECLQKNAKSTFTGATNIITIDGLRVEYTDGFGLIRSSNTTPMIVMRFEADNLIALERIKKKFRCLLKAKQQDIKLPF